MKRSSLLLVLALPMSFVLLQAGCSKQSEGQLCSTLNKDVDGVTNLDCQSGLVCKVLSTGTVGVCCAEPSSHPACVATNTTTSSSSSSASSSAGGGMGGAGGMGTGGAGGMGTGGMGTGGTSAPDAGDGG